jgi:hypothetical protein
LSTCTDSSSLRPRCGEVLTFISSGGVSIFIFEEGDVK